MAQQVSSLPQKLKTSFEPVLGPVISRSLADDNYKAVANQVRQVGFWTIAAQAGIALALSIPGEAGMGMVGPEFVAGTAALGFRALSTPRPRQAGHPRQRHPGPAELGQAHV